MSVERFNTIELRYASSDLAENKFVTEKDYLIAHELSKKILERCVLLKEENEILRAERTHWHNMYNAESALINESGLVNEMLEQ